MNFNDYKAAALATESKPEKLNFSTTGLAMLLNAGIQMSNIMDTAKKTMFYGKSLNEDDFRESIEKLQSQLTAIKNATRGIGTPTEDCAFLTEPNLRVAHGAIGIFGESGELLQAALNEMLHGTLDRVNTGEELGDVFWYAAIIADETGVSFDQAQEVNVAKLKKRYGDKFSNEAALNRDLKAEREILEREMLEPKRF